MGDFLRDAIDFVRERASAAKTGDYGPVHLGAELFALASLIARREADPFLADAWDASPPPKSTHDLRDQLAGLSGALTARELYGRLGAALDFITGLYAPDTDAEALPPVTVLPGRRIGGLSLEGKVYHWLRPGSILAREREFRLKEAPGLYEEAHARGEPFSLPPAPVEDPVVHLGSIGMYWQRPGDTVPRFSPPAVSFDASVPLLWARAEKLRSGFRIALCPLRGEFRPQFEVLPCGKHFRVFRDRDMEGEEYLRMHLDRLLEAAAQERIHLLVLPELMVSPNVRKHLESALRRRGRSLYPWGVIGGSFHVWQSGARPANECVVYDHRGRELLRHRKRGAFRILKHHVSSRFFPRVPVKLFPRIFEDIEKGEVLEVLETPLGRLAVLICADAIVRDSEGLLQLVKEVRPDLLFVVSMTPETREFDDLLEELSGFSISTLFVNAACVLPRPRPEDGGERDPAKPEDRLLAACRLGLWEGPGKPPTRLRWSSLAADAECAYFHSRDGHQGWRTLADAHTRVGPPGAFLLRHEDEALALVVDLGPQYRHEPEVIRKALTPRRGRVRKG